MIPYASRTGSKRNLDALWAHGWRLLVSARGVLRAEGFRYALDNGAWTAFQKGHPFDARAFEKALLRLGRGADWIVVPDVVADRAASLRLTERWLPRVEACGVPMLISVQDGMTEADVDAWVCGGAGIFLGGSTEWKLANAERWGMYCAARGAYYHIARVNSERRIHLAREAGAHSFDGTACTRFSVNTPRLTRAIRADAQQSLWTRRPQ